MNLEEIKAALQSDESLQTGLVEILPTLPKGKEYLENVKKAHFEENVGQKIGELHGKYDTDFSSVLGITKPDGKKSYEFWREQVKLLKEKADSADGSKLTEYQNKIKELEAKISSGEGAKLLKEQIAALEEKYGKDISAREETIVGLQKQIQNGAVQGKLNSALSSLKINSDLPKSLTDSFIANVMGDIIKEAKFDEAGNVIFYEGGKPKLNTLAGPISAEDLLKEKLQDILAKDHKQKGGGGAGGAGGGSNPIQISGAKSQDQLRTAIEDMLLKDGLEKNSIEFIKKADKLFIENKGNSLPLR